MGTEMADLPRLWIPLAPRSWECHLFQRYRISCPPPPLFFLYLVYLIPRISLVAERGKSLTKQQGINTKSNSFAELFHISKKKRRTANSGKHKEFPTDRGYSNHHPWKCSQSCGSQLIKPSCNICTSSNISVEVRYLSSSFAKWVKLGFLPVFLLFLQLQLCRAGKQYKKGGKTWTRPSAVGGYERQS